LQLLNVTNHIYILNQDVHMSYSDMPCIAF